MSDHVTAHGDSTASFLTYWGSVSVYPPLLGGIRVYGTKQLTPLAPTQLRPRVSPKKGMTGKRLRKGRGAYMELLVWKKSCRQLDHASMRSHEVRLRKVSHVVREYSSRYGGNPQFQRRVKREMAHRCRYEARQTPSRARGIRRSTVPITRGNSGGHGAVDTTGPRFAQARVKGAGIPFKEMTTTGVTLSQC